MIRVTILADKLETCWYEMRQWLLENIGPELITDKAKCNRYDMDRFEQNNDLWCIFIDYQDYEIFFKNPDHAILFKLTWC